MRAPAMLDSSRLEPVSASALQSATTPRDRVAVDRLLRRPMPLGVRGVGVFDELVQQVAQVFRVLFVNHEAPPIDGRT